jgi:hypothetical protein
MSFSVHTVNTLSDNFSYILVCNETKVLGFHFFAGFSDGSGGSTRRLWIRWSRRRSSRWPSSWA